MEEKTDVPVETHENAATESEPKHNSSGWYKATFLRRFGANLLDGLILMVVQLVVVFILPENLRSFTFLINLLYSVLFIWQKGATPGKMALGIKVVRTNGQNLNILQAFLREVVGKFISGFVFGLGYLWMLWDQNSQTWHDKIAGTYVVTKIPNDGKKSGCLVALVIGAIAIIPIIAILAAVVVMIINPLELTRRSRDAARFTDGVQLQAAINTMVQEANNAQTPFSLCVGSPEGEYCTGRSDKDSLNSDGTGWIKVDVSQNPAFPMAALLKDPVNTDEFHYTYCSDGADWEINFPLESEQQKAKLVEDEGDNNNVYELGSSLTVCK